MDKVALLAAVQAGTLTESDRQTLAEAVETHDLAASINAQVADFVEARRRGTGAFDISSLFTLLSTVLPGLMTLIPGIGPIAALIPGIIAAVNGFIALFGGKPLPVPPVPTPTPTPVPGGVIPPVPVASPN